MKKKILKYALLFLLVPLSGCDDFFNVKTDNTLNHGDYIDEESEMYFGYIGVITKMQAIGDKIIYLTDTRAELLEPTVNTPNELYSIYNYDEDLTGNCYADPAPYYDVIIACNDYLLKLYDYKEKNKSTIDMTSYQALISSTLRVKAWTYLTMAKIYGQAVWFDDPMREKKSLSSFPKMNLDEIVAKCKDLLVKGFDGVNGKLSFSWKQWADPNTSTDVSMYRYWDYMTPEYFALYAELCLWSGEYEKTVALILPAMNEKFAASLSNAYWMHGEELRDKYSVLWNATVPFARETVSAIIYDYSKNQTNSLLKHFGTEYPNQYLLAPSKVGMGRFTDPIFNPIGVKPDQRTDLTFTKNDAGNYVIQKFRPIKGAVRTNAYQDDVHIYIYRAADLYFMLAEALNNLKRYPEASALINQGVNGTFPNGGVTWAGFTDFWTGTTPLGTRKYPDLGIRGTHQLGSRPFTNDTRENDMKILDEMMLEFPCEGRTYPAMIRMAKRYNDYSIIADRVCPKYPNNEIIRFKIMDGKYFIPWDLKNE